MTFVFPSGFILRMIFPLHFEELGNLLMSPTFSLIKNADRLLFVRKVLLQFKHIMIHCPDRILEAAMKLRHMKDIMHLRKVWWQFQLICHFSSTSENTKRANVARS